MTPTEIIADVCAAPWVDRAYQAEFIVASLERDGWEIRRKGGDGVVLLPAEVIFDPPLTPDQERILQWRIYTDLRVKPNDWPPPQPETHGSIYIGYIDVEMWSLQNNPERKPQ